MTARKRSERRKKTVTLAGRFSPEEASTVRGKAQACGGVSPFIRHLTLDAPALRHVTDRDAIDHLMQALAAIKAELGKSGSNLNQLTKYANMDRVLTNSIAAVIEEHGQAIRTLQELRIACMQALGYERNRKPPK
jgi:Bacterial mobilisation protein (MobC)